MDHKERSFLVKRISQAWDMRYVNFNQDRIMVKFIDPCPDLVFQSEFIYKDAEEKARINGLLTHNEAMELLISEGKWSSEMDVKEKQLEEAIKSLKSSLNKLKFQKIQQRKNKSALESAERSLTELYKIKNQLNAVTIENFADLTQKRWIIKRSIQVLDSSKDYLKDNEKFVDRCVFDYYNDSVPKVSQIREIARSEPWRMYWTFSKDTSTPLFNHSALEMTEIQYALTMWSRIYDFAFESNNRPSDEAIEDDSKFDSWYEGEIERIERERNTSEMEGNWSKGQEVFIPADREGAKEVYALNSKQNQNKLKQRFDHLKKVGGSTEANLPDVRKDLQLQANRTRSQAVVDRVKNGGN